ncbi:MAG: hypothetical protein A2622_02600 [Bdellovibrionales bacterium RIFCSPHIGHO2_01_FULL_40_29]|nr:MAG: hypothetical protein A2622_02600 [Bdellovibrionales bacterium RIFCSPHIGHO2_01_FULL_40_29]OFZ33971.1 MAG: hypothetical protein A3D17_03020 [Bdellovibrionales bacterium RIFCSPHIGHO2_02_FULL_40_15]
MISLPIDPHLKSLIETFKKSKNLILKASPGSGKTTRLPAALIHAGFKKIIVLVPKRIAAVSAADRIAEENNWELGQQVGYHVRFEPVFNAQTRLIFMTEGVFMKKAADEAFWNSIDVLIFDEFHERSALSDMALGLATERQIMDNKIQLIVMSATLNTEELSRFLPDHKTYDIAAPPFPLKLKYSLKPQRLVCDSDFYNSLVQTVQQAWTESQKDLLVFLPGFSEIRKAEVALRKKFSTVIIQILHGSVKLSEQREILKAQNFRRLILATDIAESSLTLPTVDAVIDCGLKKVSQREPKIGFGQLTLQRISLFSAKQRAGRAARVGPGICYRLWHESDERSMPEQIKPEILRSDLLEECLTLKACGVDSIQNFMWLSPPIKTHIERALMQLQTWKLLDPKSQKITDLGQNLQNLPLGLENALLFFKLSQAGFQTEAAHLVACLESVDFSKVFAQSSGQNSGGSSDLDRIFTELVLSPHGQKIKTQLKSFRLPSIKKTNADFQQVLLNLFFEDFPHRIAQRKSETDGLSSLGRGVSLQPGLQARHEDYYLLLAGYNSGDRTDISLAIGFSKSDFLDYSKTHIEQKTEYILDLEKEKTYKRQSQKVGLFTVSESARIGLSADDEMAAWPHVLLDNADALLKHHPEFSRLVEKLEFLKKKTNLNVNWDQDCQDSVVTQLRENTKTLSDFLRYPLTHLMKLSLNEDARQAVDQLPNQMVLPSGRSVAIDYSGENAPMISAKIQDFYGMKETPTLLNQKIPLTLQLLAPNLRPTQITQNLKLFWEKSYFEIRKELKARYPKQQWPDNPADSILEPRKKP